MTFSELGLSPEILSAITDMGFTEPTPIQESAIPVILSKDHDLVALAQTGTGKTAAFGLPVIGQIDYESRTIQALMLAPTRELCVQITKDLEKFGAYCKGLRIAAVYGGASMEGQIRQLKQGPQIVVGTPGRTLDMIRRGALKVADIRWLVLDEADEMLKMGFQEDMDAILAATPETRQTLLFSATMPQEIVGMTRRYMKNPQEISVGVKNTGSANVEHWYYVVHPKDKYLALKRIADLHPDIYGIVFCKTRIETQEIASSLIADNYNADALHGDLSQSQRDHVMARFRSGHLQLLIATDVAARGLDVDDLTHVINYRLPDQLDSYIHRSGRTGRAGKKGISISIVSSRDRRLVKQLEYSIKKPFVEKRIPTGSEIVQQQLMNHIAKVEATSFDAERMAPFMDPIYDQLKDFSREELIQKFMAMEFSRLLGYYQRAGDLQGDNGYQTRERTDRRDDRREERRERPVTERAERSSRPERREMDRPARDMAEPFVRSESTERPARKPREEFAPKSASKGYVRFFINLGSKNDLTAPKLINMINNNDDLRQAQIGKIEILKKFSFFELDSTYVGRAAEQLSGMDYDGVTVHVEQAEAPKAPAIIIKDKSGFGKKREESGYPAKRTEASGFASKRPARREGGDGFWSKAPVGAKVGGKGKPMKSSISTKPKKRNTGGWD